jgi:hypothetical protein
MLVFPSLFEGFGMPPIEAMAAGCPVAVSSATCLPEICGDAAEYFNPHNPEDLANTISRLRLDGQRRRRLVERGRVRARYFSAERMAHRHLEAFGLAREKYAWPRYCWHRVCYQPYHALRVDAARLLGRFQTPSRDYRACRIVFGRGWYSAEESDLGVVRWTDHVGTVRIHVSEEMVLSVEGEVASTRSPNEVHVNCNGKTILSWESRGEFAFRKIPQLLIPLQPGTNIVEFASASPGIRASPNDTRILAIALRNVSFSDRGCSIPCTISRLR